MLKRQHMICGLSTCTAACLGLRAQLCCSTGHGDPAQREQPFIVTTNPDSLIRSRRSHYEALLQLEQQSAVVVERNLAHVDLALSPSICLCAWTETQLLQASCCYPSCLKPLFRCVAMLLLPDLSGSYDFECFLHVSISCCCIDTDWSPNTSCECAATDGAFA